jgi:large subunit ribosomal protein L25
MKEVLETKIRSELGSNAVKRVRKAGCVPAILYGHGQSNVNLSIPADQVHAVIRHGSRLVDLRGDLNESALLREVQWDTFGVEVLHVDLARVSATEKVHVTLPLELRGEAPGSHEGGIVELLVHEIEIECVAAKIPEKIEVRVSALHVGGSIAASEISLPEDVKLAADPDMMVVHCVGRAVELEEEEAAAEAEPSEPTVIGRKAEEQEEGN